MSVYDDAQHMADEKWGTGPMSPYVKKVAQALLDLVDAADPVAARVDYAEQYRSFRDADDSEMFPVRLGDLRKLDATLRRIREETT